jgi:hypothetical protein
MHGGGYKNIFEQCDTLYNFFSGSGSQCTRDISGQRAMREREFSTGMLEAACLQTETV